MTPEPTILGEHGEGYCRTCHFIEPLTPEGLLAVHWRGAGVLPENDRRCKGSLKKPPKRTPVTSRVSAFTSSPPTSVCRYCATEVAVTGHRVFARHWKGATVCHGTSTRPDGAISPGRRDHSNERG